MSRTDLIAIFDSYKCRIQLHAPACVALNRAGWKSGELVTSRKGMHAFPWDAFQAADAEEMGHKVVTCKCAK